MIGQYYLGKGVYIMNVLTELINKYPNLEVVAAVDNSTYCEEDITSYGKIDLNKAYIEDIYKGKYDWYLRSKNSIEDIFNAEGDVYRYDDAEEYADALNDFAQSLQWDKVIVVRVKTIV